MWEFSTNQGVIALPMTDCEAFARNAYRRMVERINVTLADAARSHIRIPPLFASTPDWYQAEAEIDAAASQNDYAKTIDLCEAYETRVAAYCQRFLEKARRA